MNNAVNTAIDAAMNTVEVVADASAPRRRQRTQARRLRAWFNNLSFFMFVLVVVVPTIAASIYFGLVASSQYMVEVRLAVRASQLVTASDNIIAKLAAAHSQPNVGKETYVVANYIRSRNIVRQLNTDGSLNRIYSSPRIDYFSRFDAKGTDDELWKYSRNTLMASVDRGSGVVTLRVMAFSPKDALTMAQNVLRLTEILVNGYSEKMRADILRSTKQDMADATARYRDSLLAIRNFRDIDGVIDPVQEVQSIVTALLGAELARSSVEREIAVASRTLSPDAPTMRIMNGKSAALAEQIKALQEQLTAKNEDRRATSKIITQFDELEFNRMFAERLLSITRKSFQDALLEAGRQHMYLVKFVEPHLPEEAGYPRRAISTLLVFFGLCLIWVVGRLVVAGVNDATL